MANNERLDKEVAIYQVENGALELPIDIDRDTVWVSLDQISRLFGRDRSVISRHLTNIFKDKELSKEPVIAIFAITAADGKTYNVKHYNLDVVLAVGFRVSSKQAILFRQWANSTLRQYAIHGYIVDRDRIRHNLDSFLRAVEDIKLIGSGSERVEKTDVLELVKAFAGTWFSLDAYDRSALPESGATRESVAITADELQSALSEFKSALVDNGEASELFAQPRERGALQGIIGNIFQTFNGQDVYSSVEEKAAQLLYFIVKNHIFVDGNKRSGAFAFVWFLRKASLLRSDQLTPTALTALTLLIAESDPRQKERMIGLVLLLLKNK